MNYQILNRDEIDYWAVSNDESLIDVIAGVRDRVRRRGPAGDRRHRLGVPAQPARVHSARLHQAGEGGMKERTYMHWILLVIT